MDQRLLGSASMAPLSPDGEARLPNNRRGPGSDRPGPGRTARRRCSGGSTVRKKLPAVRIPPGPVVRQARVGEGLEPKPGDPGPAARRLDRVGVDGRIRAAGQDRAVGQPGQRGTRGGGHHVGQEDGPARRGVGLREQLGQGRGGRLVVGRAGRAAARRATGPAPGPSPTPPPSRRARAAGRGRPIARGRRAAPPWPVSGRPVPAKSRRGDRATRRARSRGTRRRPGSRGRARRRPRRPRCRPARPGRGCGAASPRRRRPRVRPPGPMPAPGPRGSGLSRSRWRRSGSRRG